MHRRFERKILLVEGIQQTELGRVMSIDVSAGNYPMKKQRLTCITSADKKVIMGKTAL